MKTTREEILQDIQTRVIRERNHVANPLAVQQLSPMELAKDAIRYLIIVEDIVRSAGSDESLAKKVLEYERTFFSKWDIKWAKYVLEKTTEQK